MKSKSLFAALCLLPLPLVAADPPSAESQLLEGMVNPGYHEQPAWFKQSFLDIREDVREATDAGRRVMLYFYQDGCPYCKKLLESNFGLRDVTATTRRYLDVVAVNMWGDREVVDLQGKATTEKQFAADLKVMFTPTLLFLDESGEVVMRLNGYYPPHKFTAVVEYVGQRRNATTSFRDYWASQSPPAASTRLHHDPGYLQPPYRLDQRGSGKPLLVLFEQTDCAHCDELHQDILKREQSRALLQGFDVVLLDVWGDTPLHTPAGEPTSAAKWARALDIQYAPTLVMFDADGDEAFRTEAYLKAFHIQSALDYVLSGDYRSQPSFQRFVQARAAALEAQGIHVDLME
jgi:thioredoxin-related protein